MTNSLLPSYLEGPRVTVRLWDRSDAAAIGRAVEESLPRLAPFMAWAAQEPLALDERMELIDSWCEMWRRGEDSHLGIFREGMVVGSAGLHRHGDGTRVEIGYWLRTGHTGRGYATETVRLLTRAALELDDVDVVAIHHDVANVASRRVAERLGFRRARQVRTPVEAPGQSGSELQWEMTTAEWFGG